MGILPMRITGVPPVEVLEVQTHEQDARATHGRDARATNMLSDEIKNAIREEIARSHSKRAAIPDVLKIVQKHRRWVDDESLEEVSKIMGFSVEELDSIATFYTLIFRKLVGRHVILLCDSVSCYVCGYENLLKHLEAKLGITLGQTTSDGRFTLLPNACLGLCEIAPAMMVDQDTHGNLTPRRIDEILSKYE